MQDIKKPITIIVTIICVIVAGTMIYKHLSEESTGNLDGFKGQTMWMKCHNTNCRAEFQIDKQLYFDYERENIADIDATRPPGYPCPKCSEKSAYRAIKCSECEFVFERNSIPGHPDKCPKCGYSELEQRGKRVR